MTDLLKDDPWGEKQNSKSETQNVAKKVSPKATVSIGITDALDEVVKQIGGSARAGQIEMALAVDSAMESGKHLLVQAGTGTGKSLGYLVPAILRAARGVRQDGSNRTIVATATLALQRQLAEHDLPAAINALNPKLDKDVSFAVLKGRSNFVCLDKFHRATGEPDDDDLALFEVSTSKLAKQAKKLREWVKKTETGDRDEYSDDLDSRLWRSVSVSGRECVGASKCAWGQDCFAEKSKEKAHSSDIVVTNHALLAIDLIDGIPLVPEHDSVVIDEAHELVDRTTSALAGSLDSKSIERVTGLARKYVEPATHDRLLEVADTLAVILEALPVSGTVSRLEELPRELHACLTAIRDVTRVALSEVASSSQDEPDVAAAKQRSKGNLSEIADTAAAILVDDQYSVRWLDVSRDATLHHAPLSVAIFLAESLFTDRTVVLTSATLQVSGSMEATAKGVGVDQVGDWTGLDVGSPFDYTKQGILYCAAHLPPPTSAGLPEEMLDELGDLIEAAGGRTLSLFSSWRGVERAQEYLEVRFRGREDRPLIIASRGDSIAELVKRFRQTPQASLLGTVSLWQGIDVPGDTCTLVTIDRIPFPRPDDPVMAARSARVDASGGSGFSSVSLPKAALLLAQGVGRLIRTTEDQGVVAVLDSRLATKGYGQSLRRSVPPLWWTTDAKVVRESLANLNAKALLNTDEPA